MQAVQPSHSCHPLCAAAGRAASRTPCSLRRASWRGSNQAQHTATASCGWVGAQGRCSTRVSIPPGCLLADLLACLPAADSDRAAYLCAGTVAVLCAAAQCEQTVVRALCLLSLCVHDTAQDVVALIAYEQPQQSPLAHLLALSQREVVADAVNAAILQASSSGPGDGAAARGSSSKPQVRLLCRHPHTGHRRALLLAGCACGKLIPALSCCCVAECPGDTLTAASGHTRGAARRIWRHRRGVQAARPPQPANKLLTQHVQLCTLYHQHRARAGVRRNSTSRPWSAGPGQRGC